MSLVQQQTQQLTASELAVLSLLDSTDFGFVACQNSKLENLLCKAIDILDNYLRANLDGPIDPRIYCKLGHYHLLLKNYQRALSAYQQYFALDSEHYKDLPFLYGLGLIYFHYSAYRW